jgi:hypothetical protein
MCYIEGEHNIEDVEICLPSGIYKRFLYPYSESFIVKLCNQKFKRALAARMIN